MARIVTTRVPLQAPSEESGKPATIKVPEVVTVRDRKRRHEPTGSG